MKKGALLWIWALSLCFLLIWCSNSNISKVEAQDAALKDSNWTRNDVEFTKTELNHEKNTYEINFTADWDYTYEYEINAKNWEVVVDEDFAVYTEKDAQNIAYADVGYTKDDITLLSSEEKTIDEKPYYEVEFVDEWSKICNYTVSATDWEIAKSSCKNSTYRKDHQKEINEEDIQEEDQK